MWIELISTAALYSTSSYLAQILFSRTLTIIILLCVVLFAVALGLIVDAYWTHHQRTKNVSLTDQHEQLKQNMQFITVSPFPSRKSIDKADMKYIMQRIQKCMIEKRPIEISIAGVNVQSNIHVREGDPDFVILYIGGSWHGLFPSYPVLNKKIGVCGGITESMLGFRAASLLQLPYPLVTFNFPTGQVHSLNIGQNDDCILLQHAYESVLEQIANPKTKIIIMSDCLGSLRVLNWVSKARDFVSDSLGGLILESPLLSLRHSMNIVSAYDPINELCYRALSLILPNFDQTKDLYQGFAESSRKAFPQVPTLIGSISGDGMCDEKEVSVVNKKFQQSPLVRHHKSENESLEGKPVRHGQLILTPSFQTAVRDFLCDVLKHLED